VIGCRHHPALASERVDTGARLPDFPIVNGYAWIMMSSDDFPSQRGRLRESVGYLNWLYNPLCALDARGVYDLISTRTPTERGLYLNLGFWQTATTVDEASEALALLVGETAQIGNGDTVLDCGFGFGDQDILWAQKLAPRRIIGLNITPSQVAVARCRVAEAGLADRVDLRTGSATRMPIESSSVDKVVALECAFHFRTRERFFREAWRVLRPGGRLVCADIIPMPLAKHLPARSRRRIIWSMMARTFVIPPENAYPLACYRSKLADNGFEQVCVDSIREDVYGPLHQYLIANPHVLSRLHPMARLPVRLMMRFEATRVYGSLDYVLATATKPQG